MGTSRTSLPQRRRNATGATKASLTAIAQRFPAPMKNTRATRVPKRIRDRERAIACAEPGQRFGANQCRLLAETTARKFAVVTVELAKRGVRIAGHELGAR